MKSKLPSASIRKTKRVVCIGWLPKSPRAGIIQLAAHTPDAVRSVMRTAPDVLCIGRGLIATPSEKRNLIKTITASGTELVVQSARQERKRRC